VRQQAKELPGGEPGRAQEGTGRHDARH
jgi:hypothetical protein